MSAREDKILRNLYLEFRIPSDQYQRRPEEKERYTAVWNEITERNDSPGELIHYIVTQRKQKVKNWPTFGGKHKRLESMPDDFLSRGEWVALEAIYEEMLVAHGLGSDNFAYDDELASELSKRFFDRTGRVVCGSLLFAALMARRKRGRLVTIRENTGFRDINEVG